MNTAMSLPSRECGLKFLATNPNCHYTLSLPSRECGLKYIPLPYMDIRMAVTPFAGVWIEISSGEPFTNESFCHSLRGSVD